MSENEIKEMLLDIINNGAEYEYTYKDSNGDYRPWQKYALGYEICPYYEFRKKTNLFTDVNEFIQSVEGGNYNAVLMVPGSLVYALEAHYALENAIEKHNGFFVDKSKWDNPSVVEALMKADKICYNPKDIKLEALSELFYDWDKIEKSFTLFGFKGCDKEKIIHSLYTKMYELENRNYDIDSNQGYVYTVTVERFFIINVSYYPETDSIEFMITYSPFSGASYSYEWDE